MSNPEFDERDNNFTIGTANGNLRINLAKARYVFCLSPVG